MKSMGRLEVKWTPAAQAAVEKVTHLLEHECWVRLPDRTKPFYLYTDYSEFGIGGALM